MQQIQVNQQNDQEEKNNPTTPNNRQVVYLEDEAPLDIVVVDDTDKQDIVGFDISRVWGLVLSLMQSKSKTLEDPIFDAKQFVDLYENEILASDPKSLLSELISIALTGQAKERSYAETWNMRSGPLTPIVGVKIDNTYSLAPEYDPFSLNQFPEMTDREYDIIQQDKWKREMPFTPSSIDAAIDHSTHIGLGPPNIDVDALNTEGFGPTASGPQYIRLIGPVIDKYLIPQDDSLSVDELDDAAGSSDEVRRQIYSGDSSIPFLGFRINPSSTQKIEAIQKDFVSTFDISVYLQELFDLKNGDEVTVCQAGFCRPGTVSDTSTPDTLNISMEVEGTVESLSIDRSADGLNCLKSGYFVFPIESRNAFPFTFSRPDAFKTSFIDIKADTKSVSMPVLLRFAISMTPTLWDRIIHKRRSPDNHQVTVPNFRVAADIGGLPIMPNLAFPEPSHSMALVRDLITHDNSSFLEENTKSKNQTIDTSPSIPIESNKVRSEWDSELFGNIPTTTLGKTFIAPESLMALTSYCSPERGHLKLLKTMADETILRQLKDRHQSALDELLLSDSSTRLSSSTSAVKGGAVADRRNKKKRQAREAKNVQGPSTDCDSQIDKLKSMPISSSIHVVSSEAPNEKGGSSISANIDNLRSSEFEASEIMAFLYTEVDIGQGVDRKYPIVDRAMFIHGENTDECRSIIKKRKAQELSDKRLEILEWAKVGPGLEDRIQSLKSVLQMKSAMHSSSGTSLPSIWPQFITPKPDMDVAFGRARDMKALELDDEIVRDITEFPFYHPTAPSKSKPSIDAIYDDTGSYPDGDQVFLMKVDEFKKNTNQKMTHTRIWDPIPTAAFLTYSVQALADLSERIERDFRALDISTRPLTSQDPDGVQQLGGKKSEQKPRNKGVVAPKSKLTDASFAAGSKLKAAEAKKALRAILFACLLEMDIIPPGSPAPPRITPSLLRGSRAFIQRAVGLIDLYNPATSVRESIKEGFASLSERKNELIKKNRDAERDFPSFKREIENRIQIHAWTKHHMAILTTSAVLVAEVFLSALNSLSLSETRPKQTRPVPIQGHAGIVKNALFDKIRWAKDQLSPQTTSSPNDGAGNATQTKTLLEQTQRMMSNEIWSKSIRALGGILGLAGPDDPKERARLSQTESKLWHGFRPDHVAARKTTMSSVGLIDTMINEDRRLKISAFDKRPVKHNACCMVQIGQQFSHNEFYLSRIRATLKEIEKDNRQGVPAEKVEWLRTALTGSSGTNIGGTADRPKRMQDDSLRELLRELESNPQLSLVTPLSFKGQGSLFTPEVLTAGDGNQSSHSTFLHMTQLCAEMVRNLVASLKDKSRFVHEEDVTVVEKVKNKIDNDQNIIDAVDPLLDRAQTLWNIVTSDMDQTDRSNKISMTKKSTPTNGSLDKVDHDMYTRLFDLSVRSESFDDLRKLRLVLLSSVTSIVRPAMSCIASSSDRIKRQSACSSMLDGEISGIINEMNRAGGSVSISKQLTTNAATALKGYTSFVRRHTIELEQKYQSKSHWSEDERKSAEYMMNAVLVNSIFSSFVALSNDTEIQNPAQKDTLKIYATKVVRSILSALLRRIDYAEKGEAELRYAVKEQIDRERRELDVLKSQLSDEQRAYIEDLSKFRQVTKEDLRRMIESDKNKESAVTRGDERYLNVYTDNENENVNDMEAGQHEDAHRSYGKDVSSAPVMDNDILNEGYDDDNDNDENLHQEIDDGEGGNF